MLELGWPYPKRKQLLDELLNTPSDKTQHVPFQGKDMYLKIYTVPIGLPKYRLNNGRTYAAQAEYLATHSGEPSDLFTADLESEKAQQIQHELLRKMLGKGNLFEYFKGKGKKQSQALILNHMGFVVNGNRRLCAMRELLEGDPKEYGHFTHIGIVVLPPADEKDIDELEAVLQIEPDIKADYTWYDLALMMRKRRDNHKYDIFELANTYKMSKGDIEELIGCLEDAEAYLLDRGKAGQYHQLDQTEFAFQQLRKARSKHFKSEAEKNCFEKLSYCFIDNSAAGGRLYETIPSVAKNFDTIIDRVREEFDLKPQAVISDNAASEDLFGSDQPEIGDVLAALSDQTKLQAIRDLTIDVIESEKLKAKEQEKINFVFSQVKKANTLLIDATNTLTPHQEKSGIAGQLESIKKSIQKIEAWLDQ